MTASDEPGPVSDAALGNNTRRILLYVIAPALIAGFFSFLPKLYDVLTKARVELSYSVSSGPGIPIGATYKNIFAIFIENTGESPLSNISIDINPTAGKVETFEIGKNNLHSEVSSTSPLSINIPRMLPRDKLDISAMVSSPTDAPNLEISGRSDQVVASKREQGKNGSSDYLTVVAAILTGTFVLITMIFMYFSQRDINKRIENTRLEIEKLEKLTDVNEVDREQIILYIALLSGITAKLTELPIRGNEIQYAQISDIFLVNALHGEERIKRNCRLGLRALLLVGPMAPSSVQKIRQNLELLEVKVDDEDFAELREHAVRLTELDLRREIFELFKE